MRNTVSSSPLRLSYTVRGPELAIALPQDNESAFDDLTRQLCRSWNGVGTLLLPVDADGDVIRWDQWLPMLPPDFVYVHDAIGDLAARCIAHDFPGRTSRWSSRVTEREIHPWWLLGVRSTDPRGQLLVPEPNDLGLQRLVRVLWGDLDAEEAEHARRYFDLEHIGDDRIVQALVHAQIYRRSPLAWSAVATDFVECVNAGDQRVLFVFSAEPRTDELLEFWNIRARIQTSAGEATVLGLPAAALEQPETLALLHEWLDRTRGSKPDIRVSIDKTKAERATQALIEAGFTHVDTGRFQSWASIPPERARPEFTLRKPLFAAKLRRGLAADALVGLAEGPNPLHLATPARLPTTITWKGLMRVELRGLPIAFPLTDPLARLCMRDAQATGSRGIVIAVGATTEPLRLDINLPTPEAQLHAHLTSCALAGRESGAGRIASTLLGRLPDTRALDALTHPLVPVLLDTLVARSRPKLAQHVATQLAKLQRPIAIDEQLIVDILREEGLFSDRDS